MHPSTPHTAGTDDGPAAGESGGHGADAGAAVPRRGVLRAVAVGVAAAAGLGGAAGTAGAQSDGTDLASWFAGVSNYEGVIDATGTDSVTVDVGVEANGGAFGFGPAAVRVDPGTTVTWRWTGRGGSHNVAADGFESELVGTTDHTFERTFAEPGVHTYACTPHETIGMKGAVVVGDVEVNAERPGGSTESGGASPPDGTGTEAAGTGTPASGDAGDEGTLGTPDATVSAPFDDAGTRRLGGLALGGVFGLALASPGLFGAFLRLAGGSDGDPADDE